MKVFRTKQNIGHRHRYSIQQASVVQQIYCGQSNKTSPQREHNMRAPITLPKTPTLFYSLRRQPKRNIQALTQSSQFERRDSTQIQTGTALTLNYDYAQISEIDILEVSQRPGIQRAVGNRKKSEVSRMQQKILFKTIELTPDNRRTHSQLSKQDDESSGKAAPCSNCSGNLNKMTSMAREIDELQDIISEMLRDASILTFDLAKAKFLIIDSKVTKDNQSIKRSHVKENLEFKVKLLQDSLTQRNQQLLEQEKQNQDLLQLLESYDLKLEVAKEQLAVKESAKKEKNADSKSILEMVAYHHERLKNLNELKEKTKYLANDHIDAGSHVQMLCEQSRQSLGHDPSNFRQSQKSINESNYSSEPLLQNVKFN